MADLGWQRYIDNEEEKAFWQGLEEFRDRARRFAIDLDFFKDYYERSEWYPFYLENEVFELAKKLTDILNAKEAETEKEAVGLANEIARKMHG